MKNKSLYILAMLSVFALMLWSCGGGGGSGSASVQSNNGKLTISFTDKASDSYQAVYVTIDEVQVHPGDVDGDGEQDQEGDMDGDGIGDSNWISFLVPRKTYNLLELVNGVMEELGTADLDSGLYTQIRLLLGDDPDAGRNILNNNHPYANYLIDSNNAAHELKIPSGYQTGIKLVHEFQIIKGLTKELVLDFDVFKSVVKAGNSGKYLLKPTIKIIDTINNSIVSGYINDGATGIQGVKVTAQVYNPDAEDEKDSVMVFSSTVTDEQGNYLMYLPPGTYNIVAYADGYTPECSGITAVLNGEYTINFQISQAQTGKIEGTVTIEEADEEENAVISFRQAGQCGNDQVVEVDSVNVSQELADGVPAPGDYSVSLPVGIYNVVAFCENRETQEDNSVEVFLNAVSLLDIIFSKSI
jgi:hypothetical protein